MSPVSSNLIAPIPASGDFNTKTEYDGWLEGVRSGKATAFCYVSDKLFSEIAGKNLTGVVCSDDEIRKMNEELGEVTFKRETLRFKLEINCDHCSRQFNFYDHFKMGMQKHGKDFLVWANKGRKKVVGVPRGSVQRIRCSDCGQEKEVSLGYETGVVMYGAY